MASSTKGTAAAVVEPANVGANLRLLGGRIHFAWIAAALVFLVLITGAGVRATPGVLIVPLEEEFGWSRASISLAIGLNIFIFGFIGPFAAAAMQHFGIRRVVIFALVLLSVTVALSTLITEQWQLILTWGVFVGIGSGCTAMILAATVAARWFSARRGLIMGVLAASLATGQLIFLPVLAFDDRMGRLADRGLDRGLRRRRDDPGSSSFSCPSAQPTSGFAPMATPRPNRLPAPGGPIPSSPRSAPSSMAPARATSGCLPGASSSVASAPTA